MKYNITTKVDDKWIKFGIVSKNDETGKLHAKFTMAQLDSLIQACNAGTIEGREFQGVKYYQLAVVEQKPFVQKAVTNNPAHVEVTALKSDEIPF